MEQTHCLPSHLSGLQLAVGYSIRHQSILLSLTDTGRGLVKVFPSISYCSTPAINLRSTDQLAVVIPMRCTCGKYVDQLPGMEVEQEVTFLCSNFVTDCGRVRVLGDGLLLICRIKG
jgi:hypothetical protein